ncbi:MAG: hypothetical protein AAGJ35_14775, partial [Myxococcota bacterium]
GDFQNGNEIPDRPGIIEKPSTGSPSVAQPARINRAPIATILMAKVDVFFLSSINVTSNLLF